MLQKASRNQPDTEYDEQKNL